tara:strand:+ start:54 stop:539 length:486 start_codon:yes stop_codon:yes gene_type:complete
MELELFNTRLKYEDDVLWRWVDTMGGRTLKNPYWRVVKQTPSKDGYSRISLDGKMYVYHRVMYKVCNPEWDIDDVSSDNQVDHICGTRPLDNSIKNLRILNHQQNQMNNLHYAKGYYYHKPSNKYLAKITINKKQIHLGYHDTPEEAREAYLKAKAIHHPI